MNYAAHQSLRRNSSHFGCVWVAVVETLEHRNGVPSHRVFRVAKGGERTLGSGKGMVGARERVQRGFVATSVFVRRRSSAYSVWPRGEH